MPVAAAIGIAGLAGAGATIYGANKAAAAQTSAARRASQTQMQMYKQGSAGLDPFIKSGTMGMNNLMGALPELTAPFRPTMAQLADTPGYQFTLGQGKLAVEDAMAAQGLGGSGAMGKGLVDYATGLAGTTYQQMFGDYLAQQGQRFNMMYSPAQLGEAAAGARMGAATTTGSGIGSNIVGAGQAVAGANILGASAVGQGLSTAAGGYAMFGPGGLYGPGGAFAPTSQNPLAATANPFDQTYGSGPTMLNSGQVVPGYGATLY